MAFEKWLSELRDLNPSGKAPQKPLLLLTVLKAAERDRDLPEGLQLSPDLVYQFKLFEHIVAHRRKQKLEISVPFRYLKSSGVWTPLDKHGEPSMHRSVTTCVRLDPDFRPDEQIALREIMGLSSDVVIPETETDETPEQEARTERRSARFRLEVGVMTVFSVQGVAERRILSAERQVYGTCVAPSIPVSTTQVLDFESRPAIVARPSQMVKLLLRRSMVRSFCSLPGHILGSSVSKDRPRRARRAKAIPWAQTNSLR